ncbi:MAG: hypothetical protein QOF60_2454 [Actinomycetota bacterium]|jgi:uncharacterized membrane protein YidH (DUF202 family)|nr:hypothetical protein [Actinomycetota bacterium]
MMQDPGMAEERTALAWNRTGLSSLAAAGVALKVFWGRSPAGVALAGLLVVMGVVAYGAGRREGRSTAQRLRLMSLAATASAVLAAIIG